MTDTLPLQALTHRLSECPPEFLLEPQISGRGEIWVDAVVADLLVDLGAERPPPARLGRFHPDDDARRDELRVVLVACWLLHDEWFRAQACFGDAALSWLDGGLEEVSAVVAADAFVNDAERREELARRCLSALGLVPAGESSSQAADRLATLDSVEQARVVSAMREREARARELRRKMEEQRAREAAARYTRE